MICEYGMSDKFRNLTLPRQDSGIDGIGGSRNYSEETQKYIDEEAEKIINERYEHVLGNLKKNWKALDEIAKKLLKEEVIEGDDFAKMADELVIREIEQD